MNAFANKSRYFSHPCGHSFAFASRIINISISFRQVYSVIWVWQYYCLMSNTHHIKVLPKRNTTTILAFACHSITEMFPEVPNIPWQVVLTRIYAKKLFCHPFSYNDIHLHTTKKIPKGIRIKGLSWQFNVIPLNREAREKTCSGDFLHLLMCESRISREMYVPEMELSWCT